MTGSFRKKLNLPITIVPDKIINYVFKNRRNTKSNTIKFIPENKLDYEGTKLYKVSDDYENSYLLSIFSIKGISSVLLNSDLYRCLKMKKRTGLF